MVFIATQRPRLLLHRAAHCMAFVAAVVMSGACDKYEPTKPIEGVYLPTQCVTLQGIIPGGWLSVHKTIHPTICQPMRVNELGVYTYGSGWSRPGARVEVGRLEYSDAGVLVKSDDLRGSGTFNYRDRAATVGDWTRNNPLKSILLAVVALVAAVSIVGGIAAAVSRRARERDRLEAEAAAKAAARVAALARLGQLASDAQAAASSLPIILGQTEMILDRAEDELASKLPSPFWEAIEEAVAKLRAFHNAMSIIEARRTEHRTLSSQLEGDVPPCTLGVSVLPDPTATHDRLNRLYRRAQSIPHFSIVYEQRRTTATLIEGFRSLGEAIERLGGSIIDEIGRLAASLDCRLASLESSLESSAAAAAEQSAALRAELQRAHGSSDAMRGQLRQDAEARAEHERLALRMLDNIQHRRKPTIFDRP